MDHAEHTAAACADDARKRLATMLSQVVDDAEQLISSAQRSGSEQFERERDKLEARLRHARAELDALGETAAHQARRAARLADGAVHDHPYAAIGMAAGVGALLALLLARR